MARKQMTTLVLGLALALAACAPSSGLETPTPPIESLPEASEPLVQPTVPSGTQAPEPTLMIPNTGGTPAAMTPQAQATPKAQATRAGTETLADEPTFMRTSAFIGYEIVTGSGQTVGVVAEVLADEAGAVHYILASVNADAGVDNRPSALPWSLLKVDPAMPQLVFTGTTADLVAAPKYDPALLDRTDAVVIEADGTQLPIEFDELIRISQYDRFDLRNTADDSLGMVNEVVVDLAQGEVSYVLVDVGRFLGTPDTTVAVPWERLALKPEAAAAARDQFVLDVSEEILRQAPTVDLNTLPTWPDPIDPNWDVPIRQFWETAG